MNNEELQTREKIVQAALELFAEHGMDGVSIRQIAARAEANVAAVNYYFGSKNGLYIKVLRRVFHECGHELPPEFLARIETAADQPELLRLFEELLTLKVEMYLGRGHEDGLLKRRLLLRALIDDSLTRELRNEYAMEFEAQILLFRKLNPQLTENQAAMAVFTLIGQLVFYIISRSGVLDILGLTDFSAAFRAELREMIRKNLSAVLDLPEKV